MALREIQAAAVLASNSSRLVAAAQTCPSGRVSFSDKNWWGGGVVRLYERGSGHIRVSTQIPKWRRKLFLRTFYDANQVSGDA